MAHLSGLVDVTEEQPTLLVTERGTVLLSLDTDTGLRFRTLQHLDAFLEQVDRLRAQHGVQQSLDTAEYHRRVVQLRDEKARL